MAVSNPARLAACLFLLLITVFLLAGTWRSQEVPHTGFVANNRFSHHVSSSNASHVLLGVGKGDITGPVVEINMMGYADTAQSGTGLRQRLYCRAFIIASPASPHNRIVYLVLDTQSGDTAVRHGILQGLKELGPEYDVYNAQTIAVTGTHSHSGPGAWLNYLLPQITSKGFDKQSYQAIVNGSVLAIQRAHESLRAGSLSVGISSTSGISANRSPFAYLANPAGERERYSTNTDVDMTLLRFTDAENDKVMGVLTWLPVHGTSLYQNNTLITGDNKGVAAYLLEEHYRKNSPEFVAGFSQANVGDTTPNILGAYCEDTGFPCRFNDSTCNGKTEECHGRGPFFQYQDQGTRSCYEIGKRQADAAQALLSSNELQEITLPIVSSFHTFFDMSNFTFVSPFNQSRILKTCSAALGYSFAGGTSDGPGKFDFTQGTNDSDKDSPALKNPLWKVARSFVHPPTEEQKECQSPKPILLDVGAAEKPYVWSPNIVDIQSLRVGPLIMIIVPGEATTMSGRRWREAVAEHAKSVLSIDNPVVVLGGPANTYTHYIATEEEFGVQRYEGASTLYGPHTLNAYVNLTLTHLPYLDSSNTNLPPLSGPRPPVNVNSSLSFITGVVVDRAGLFKEFGQVITSPDPARIHKAGDLASASFIGANPRNNLRLENTYAAVERFDGEKWDQIRSDRDWFLTFHWERTSTILGTSEVRIEWQLEEQVNTQKPALHRFRYFGDAKALGGDIRPFEGVSGTFYVGNPDSEAIEKELVRG